MKSFVCTHVFSQKVNKADKLCSLDHLYPSMSALRRKLWRYLLSKQNDSVLMVFISQLVAVNTIYLNKNIV